LLKRGTGLAAPFPAPLFLPLGFSVASLRVLSERNLLDEIDHFTGQSKSQRRFAPIVIAESENVDRFQMKSVIDFVEIRILSPGLLDRLDFASQQKETDAFAECGHAKSAPVPSVSGNGAPGFQFALSGGR
jgi:hypothetical protein